MSFSTELSAKLLILFLIFHSYHTSPSRRQCFDLINALQAVGGHLSKGVKRLSLEQMPGIYADCLHAEEGIRFKKMSSLRPLGLSRYYDYPTYINK